MDEPIRTPRGHTVPPLTLTPQMFLNRTSVLYGPSDSGKTLLTLKIAFLLRDHIDQGLVISPSNGENGSYDYTFSAPLIHERIDYPREDGKREKKGLAAERFLKKIWERQSMMVAVYKKANKTEVLASLYGRLPLAQRKIGQAQLKSFKQARKMARRRVKQAWGDDPDELKERLEELEDKLWTALTHIYKGLIIPYAGKLLRKRISEDERFSLMYLRFNPNLLLIFDDCATEGFFGGAMFKQIFYRGRHVKITAIIAAQDDTDLPANMRKGAFFSAFMSSAVCSANFERQANNFSSPIKERVSDSVDIVYQGLRKMVYLRKDSTGNHLYSLSFTKAPKFKFGSPAVRELCERAAGDVAEMDTENTYYSRFVDV